MVVLNKVLMEKELLMLTLAYLDCAFNIGLVINKEKFTENLALRNICSYHYTY